MAYPPSQSINVRNNGVGLAQTGAVFPLVVGFTSGGTANTLYAYTDPNAARDAQGHGAGVEVVLGCIQRAGGALLLRPAATTAGAAGAVTKVAFSASTGTITVAGAPHLPFRVKIRIRKTGALGVATFDYTLDDAGDDSLSTFGAIRTVPSGGTYAITGTNLTLTFSPGVGPVIFEAGDTHTFVCTAPQYTTGDLATAWTALVQQIGTRKIREVYFTHQSASASAGATMAGAVATHMATLDANNYFARAIAGAGADTAANVVTGYAAFADDRVSVVHGLAEMVTLDAFEGWGVPRVPASWVVQRRAADTGLSENLGRRQSGNLSGFVRRIRASDASWGFDERLDGGTFGEADRITTLTTQQGTPGFWVTNGYLKSLAASDFLYYDWGKVIDLICEIVKFEQDRDILRSVRVLTDGTGRLDPRDAADIEKHVRTALAAALQEATNAEGTKGHVSGLQYTVDRETNFASTRQLQSSSAAVGRFPIESISTQVGFTRSLDAA